MTPAAMLVFDPDPGSDFVFSSSRGAIDGFNRSRKLTNDFGWSKELFCLWSLAAVTDLSGAFLGALCGEPNGS